MNNCSSNAEQEYFQKPTTERLACLGSGCFVQIPYNGRCEWVELTHQEGDEYVGILHPELATTQATTTTDNQPDDQEIHLRKEHITALGCDRYCFC
jgi:hypothetical protein